MNKKLATLRGWVAVSVVFAGLTSCQSSPAQLAPLSPTAPATLAPAPTATPTVAPKPTITPIPSPTAIPGLEGWSVFNPQAVEINIAQGALVLTLKHRALWFMAERGVLVYQLVTGNFKITAAVHATKQSDSTQPPGGDGTVQLGGLMVRNGGGGRENYVFIVVGDDGNGLSVETKTTLDGESRWDGPEWGSNEAELRVCRVADTLQLYKRPVGVNTAWTLAKSLARPDLPETVQVGANIYSDSSPDLQVRYDQLRIEPVQTSAECSMD